MAVTDPLETELKKRFGFDSFRTGQKEIIQDVLRGEDVLGILPTGSGKSICYQLPALLLDGVTIVVSPLISLMIDQVKQLRANRMKRVTAINSFLAPDERRNIMRNLHTYKIIYISPELLQQEFMLNRLKQLPVRLFVIDEAHCISQWGHEFRPDYLKLEQVIRELHFPVTLALSATCPEHVQQDIMEALKKPLMKKHIYPMDRPNIAFSIEHVTEDREKIDRIQQLLASSSEPALIYFNNRNAAEECVRKLLTKLPERKIAFYHGGMEPMDRIMIQQQFMNNQLDVICCTNAFGMGINKSDIRLIIHYHFPLQLESFIQEVGRAGRDGKQSYSLLFYAPKDRVIPNSFIQNELPTDEQIRGVFHYLANKSKDDSEIHPDESEWIHLFQMNETQLRFLYYQLEKHGMIKGKTVSYDEYNWQQAFLTIQAHRDDRLHYKESKLAEMLHWIHADHCLRKALYQGFQTGFSKPLGPCCSNCSFIWTDWVPDASRAKNQLNKTWQEKLQHILLIGEAK